MILPTQRESEQGWDRASSAGAGIINLFGPENLEQVVGRDDLLGPRGMGGVDPAVGRVGKRGRRLAIEGELEAEARRALFQLDRFDFGQLALERAQQGHRQLAIDGLAPDLERLPALIPTATSRPLAAAGSAWAMMASVRFLRALM